MTLEEALNELFREVKVVEKRNYKVLFTILFKNMMTGFIKIFRKIKNKIKAFINKILRFIKYFEPNHLKEVFSKNSIKEVINPQKIKKSFTKENILSTLYYLFLILLGIAFVAPFYIVFLSSFKSKFDILLDPFGLPNNLSFIYYKEGISTISFFEAFGVSLFVSFFSCALILLSSSMISWMIVRVKNAFTKVLYYLFVLSMVVPFQLLMYPMVFISSSLNLDNMFGIIIIYMGFGAGLAVFMFTGFIKSIPIEIEEAAMMDGCSVFGIFFRIVIPILKPIYITVAILNAMWIWNDYLLPNLLLSDRRTIPVAIQMGVVNSLGGVNYSYLTALITLSIIPIIIFYIALQKYIVKGAIDGAVKG